MERLFFEDCGNIPEADKRAYIENFLSQNPRIKMEYFQQGEEIIAGVSILNNQGGLIRADELHGNSAGNLRFRCSYEL
ncbi:hypothetical protein J4427_03705 [Candidatus Woesearchaeota archaeon]|nr:hypothetical protein [Candidatus Woesearchaeota archaeon]